MIVDRAAQPDQGPLGEAPDMTEQRAKFQAELDAQCTASRPVETSRRSWTRPLINCVTFQELLGQCDRALLREVIR